jgi:pimeloyl-ACP methyl ester carboxylesterase
LFILPFVWVLALLPMASSACSRVDDQWLKIAAESDAPPIAVPVKPVKPDVWDARGRVVNGIPLGDLGDSTVAQAATATRAVYRSVEFSTGEGTEVSGEFFVPTGDAPDGGWPIIALAHGTTGIEEQCGLSAKPKLSGYLPAVSYLLENGYAVALSDYQGLGSGPPHPYLEPQTAAYNVIDAVRAIHSLNPSVSDRWLALGDSQGGEAAWAANEFAKSYGSGLDLVGSVAISPAANLSGLAQMSFTGSLSDLQKALMPMLVVGLERYDPTLSDFDLIRPDPKPTDPSVGVGCGPDVIRDGVLVSAADVKPQSKADSDALRDALRRIALPQQPLAAPMLVINGGEDKLIAPPWVTAAVARSCELGGTIEHREIPNSGHDIGMGGDDVTQWIADRFAGLPATSTCAAGF